jgi:hypothetical protein
VIVFRIARERRSGSIVVAALLGALAFGPVGCFAPASPMTEDAQSDATSGDTADTTVDRKSDDASNDRATMDVTVATDGGNDVDVASDGRNDTGTADDASVCLGVCDSTHPCPAGQQCCLPFFERLGCNACLAVCP